MRGVFVGLAAALALAACSVSPAPAQDARLDLVRAALLDPESARFTNVRDANGILCGFVNAKNTFGGYTGPRAFAVTGRTVTIEGAAVNDYDRARATGLLRGGCG